jgi:hypothetical protein
MKRFVMAGWIVTLLAGATALQAQEAPPMPAPEKEHMWLQQLVGEWETETEAVMEPGKPPIKCKGSESARSVGGFWVLAENKGSFMDMPVTGILTLGYDAGKKQYTGTWVCSMMPHIWRYEGTMDAAGKVLTLETQGPDPTSPGKLARFKDVLELKSKDHKVMTSSMQKEDGEWVTFATMHYRRKK